LLEAGGGVRALYVAGVGTGAVPTSCAGPCGRDDTVGEWSGPRIEPPQVCRSAGRARMSRPWRWPVVRARSPAIIRALSAFRIRHDRKSVVQGQSVEPGGGGTAGQKQ